MVIYHMETIKMFCLSYFRLKVNKFHMVFHANAFFFALNLHNLRTLIRRIKFN